MMAAVEGDPAKSITVLRVQYDLWKWGHGGCFQDHSYGNTQHGHSQHCWEPPFHLCHIKYDGRVVS